MKIPNPIPTVDIIIEISSGIILIKRKNPPFGFAGIAGHVDEGEENNAPREVLIREVREETGLEIGAYRIGHHQIRQIAPTLSVHRAHLFSVQVTPDELDFLRSQHGVAHGLIGDSERTYVEVMKLGEIRRQECVDWGTLGMILSILTAE